MPRTYEVEHNGRVYEVTIPDTESGTPSRREPLATLLGVPDPSRRGDSLVQSGIEGTLQATRPLNPLMPLIEGARNLTRQRPGVAETMSAAAGGVLGSRVGGTPGSIIGTGLGGGIGRLATRGREFLAGEGRGATMTPPEAGQEFRDVAGTDTLLAALGIPLSKGAVGFAKTIGRGAEPAVTRIAGRVRESFTAARESLGKQFGEQLDQLVKKFPDRHVSLIEPIQKIKLALKRPDLFPQLRKDVHQAIRQQNRPILMRLLKYPHEAADLTLREAQDVKNALTAVKRLRSKSGRFAADFEQGDFDLLDLINDTRQAMLEAFPDELPQVNAQFARGIQAFHTLRNRFKVGSLVGNIERNFGDPEVRALIQEFLPPGAQQDIQLLGKALRLRSQASSAKGMALRYGGYGLLGLLGIRHLLRGRGGQFEE